MKPDPKAYLDNYFASEGMKADIVKLGEPNCYLVYKTRPPNDYVPEGEALAIYGTKDGFYKRFPELVEKLDSKWGIAIAVAWFDD